jgi:hypothetical protein
VKLILILLLTTYALIAGCSITSTVATVEDENPEWLSELIHRLESEPVANPPASIYQYEYKGAVVYYLPPRCCDIPSDLHDKEGRIICHPDGGMMGVGDGRCTDFFDERENEKLIWKDDRAYR